ncbi:unnamed protein product [Alopecurus aequalis]
MAGLQRSSGTFRRSGSSGMVWDDDRHLSGEIARPSPARRDDGRRLSGEIARPSPARVQRSRSTGTGHRASAGRVSPALDPPSPRVGVCSFCGFFSDKAKKKKDGGGKARPKKIAPRAGQAAAGSPRRRRASG